MKFPFVRLVKRRRIIGLLLAPIILLSIGCGGYPITYELTKNEIIFHHTTKPLNVLVVKFSDLRPPEERTEKARTALKYPNISNYTYDDEFEGKVNEEISKMIAEHIKYSKVFARVDFLPVSADNITEKYADSLRQAGIDAILYGELLHFYSYYYTDAIDIFIPVALGCAVGIPLIINSIKKETVYIMGKEFTTVHTDLGMELVADFCGSMATGLGEILVNTRGRDFAWHTTFAYRLLNISNGAVYCEDTIESYSKGHQAFTGFGKDKFKLAIESLRYATIKMVSSLYVGSVGTEAVVDHIRKDSISAFGMQRESEETTSTFTIHLKSGDTTSILNGVLVTYATKNWPIALVSFKNILGVARDLDGPFERTSMEIEGDDVFYFQAETLVVYRVQVIQDGDSATLTLNEM
jgi:hypothetical protein